jgi:protein phosphatase methylesterase 1
MIIIDVVEGTAMEALPFMESIIKSMPKSFSSLEEAIQYTYIYTSLVILVKL